MKKIILLLLVIVITFGLASPASAKSKPSNKSLVKKYCVTYYHKSPKYVKENSKAIFKHKGKMIVEVVLTTSKGKYGVTKKGYHIRYNKKVKKGKKVTSYLIYNPKTNAIDDVVAVVDNNKIRGDRIKTKPKKPVAKPTPKIDCPNCDGTDHKCVYWYIDNATGKEQHMTTEQRIEFEKMEAREII